MKVRMIEELPDDTGFMKKNERRLPIFNFSSSGKGYLEDESNDE
jgi:hypothetical protein